MLCEKELQQMDENLWNCVVAFQRHTFYTYSGLAFSYTLKRGKNGKYTKELWVDRMKKSKSLAWSSVLLAFHAAIAMREKPDEIATVKKPKDLGDIRGVSYIYPLLCQFGVIRAER